MTSHKTSIVAARPDTEFVTVFETAVLDDGVANVMRFNYPGGAGNTPALGYILPHGILPNGGGEKANQYTLIMDIMFQLPARASARFCKSRPTTRQMATSS